MNRGTCIEIGEVRLRPDPTSANVLGPLALAVVSMGIALRFIALPAAAIAHEADSPPHIQVTGVSELSAAPDLARLRVSIVSDGQDAAKVSEDNARRSSAVEKALDGAVAKAGTVTTESFGISPRHRWRDGEQILVGYRAQNTLLVELEVLDRIAPAIDAAMAAGADAVLNLEFTVRDDTEIRARALSLASRRAREKASAIAEALGAEIVRTLALQEQSSRVRRQPVVMHEMAGAMKADAVPTQVTPGPVKVEAQVTLRVEISD